MPSIELNKDINLVVQVRLISRGNDEPVSGKEFKVRLYDKDIFNDDFLGETSLDEEGVAKFVFTQQDFKSPLSLDQKPDFYFVVLQNNETIFKSKVMSNLDISNVEEFVMSEGDLIDLGTFLIDTN